MNSNIEGLCQEIGAEALAIAGAPQGKVLSYAEVDEGVVSAQIFYEKNGKIIFKFASAALGNQVYELWQACQEAQSAQPWRAMAYLIEGQKFSLDLIYPNKFDAAADTVSRRTLAAERVFGTLPFDYSLA